MRGRYGGGEAENIDGELREPELGPRCVVDEVVFAAIGLVVDVEEQFCSAGDGYLLLGNFVFKPLRPAQDFVQCFWLMEVRFCDHSQALGCVAEKVQLALWMSEGKLAKVSDVQAGHARTSQALHRRTERPLPHGCP